MRKKKEPMPLGTAIFLLIAGLFMGSIFSFGMRYWNKTVIREECVVVETTISSYERIQDKEIAIDCGNGQRYFIDGVSINTKLLRELSSLAPSENITLLIHPNSSTILEFTTENTQLLIFEETIVKLADEANGFLFLGVFMYIFAAMGLYYILWHVFKRI